MQLCASWACCKGAIYVLLVVFALIVVYYIYKRVSGGNIAAEDPLNQKVFNLACLENCCSWWPISHFFLYAILGFFFPQCFFLLLIIGILYELFEMVLAKAFGTERQPIADAGQVEYSRNWWSGSMKDILFNVLGLVTGVALAYAYTSWYRQEPPCCHRDQV